MFCIAGSSDELFSVEIHHSGFFCGIGKKRTYMDAKIDWWDHCNNDIWSLLYVEEFLKELKIVFTGHVRVYWSVPTKTVAEGLNPLKCDAHIVEMNNVTRTEKKICLYVDHHNLLERQKSKMVDDIQVDGGKQMPSLCGDAFVSPKKKRQNENGQGTVMFASDVVAGEEDGGHSEDESGSDVEFADSDYDIDGDDGDLYEHNIDDEVEEEIKEMKENELVYVLDDGGDSDEPNHEELHLPVCEEGESINFNFKTFRAEIDMKSPIFKVGMVF